MTEKLTEAQIKSLTSAGWTLSDDKNSVTKAYKFNDFTEAFAFMTQAALFAEKWDHHPDWNNVYSNVNVTLTTHDAGGLTELDLKLASKMDELAG